MASSPPGGFRGGGVIVFDGVVAETTSPSKPVVKSVNFPSSLSSTLGSDNHSDNDNDDGFNRRTIWQARAASIQQKSAFKMAALDMAAEGADSTSESLLHSPITPMRHGAKTLGASKGKKLYQTAFSPPQTANAHNVKEELEQDIIKMLDDVHFGAAAEPILALVRGAREFTMPPSELRPRDTRAICYAFSSAKSLITANFADTGVGVAPDCLSYLAEHSKTIKTLDLTSVKLTDDGAKMLAEGVGNARSLQHLFVGFNSIGGEGAAALVTAALRTSTVRSLDLSHNPLGDGGTHDVATALMCTDAPMSTFEALHMDCVGAGPSGARAMAAAFARPVGVHPLHLHPGASPRNAQDAPRVDLAFLSFVGNDPGDAVEAFERAVSLAESIPHDEAALGDRHVVRKRVVLQDDDQTAAE